ncbi:MAG: rhodanese-like domain-containing protein [Pseudomonadota bacterium]
MRILISILALTFTFATSAFAATFGPLVDAQSLSNSRAETKPVLLDIRGDAYDEGHIEGAVSAPYALFRGPKENPGQLFDVEALEANLEKIGLTQDQPIVIVSAGSNSTDFGAAARVYWTLKSTGFSDLSILNGGQASWVSAGLPVSSEKTTLAPTELELVFNEAWHADTDDVSKVVSGETSATLVDARLKPFFTGDKAHPAAKQPGTLPGAVNHAFTTFFNDDSPAISNITDVSALKTSLGVEDGEDVVSFCNTGHWAATHWFALSEIAGIENAKLYPGSMVEYSNADLPMENSPGLLKNLLNQITK